MRIAYFETPIADASTSYGALVEDLTLETTASTSDETHITDSGPRRDERHCETEPIVGRYRSQRFQKTEMELDPRLVETQLFHTRLLQRPELDELEQTKVIPMPRSRFDRIVGWLCRFLTKLGVLPTRLPDIT